MLKRVTMLVQIFFLEMFFLVIITSRMMGYEIY